SKRRHAGQRWMKMGSETEGQPHGLQTAARPINAAFDSHAELGEHIGAAAPAGDGPVAVLDYRDTGRRYDQCGGGADVERPQAIAARPTSVEDGFSWGFQTDHMRAQDSRRRGQLNSALAF